MTRTVKNRNISTPDHGAKHQVSWCLEDTKKKQRLKTHVKISDGAVRENRETGPDRPGFETGPDRIFTHKKVVEQEYKYIY